MNLDEAKRRAWKRCEETGDTVIISETAPGEYTTQDKGRPVLGVAIRLTESGDFTPAWFEL